MKLFTLDYQLGEYMHQVNADEENQGLFWGCEYRKDGNYSDVVSQLRYYLKLDDHGKLMTAYYNYESIDFFAGPTIVSSDTKSLELEFYVVSPRLKKLLEQLILPEHRYYSIELDIDGKLPLKPYFILQINLDEHQFLDCKASTFYRRERIDRGVYKMIHYKQGEISSYKALQFIKEELSQYPYPKTMVLNKSLDWLYYKPFSLITAKAQQLFAKHNITGLEIIPIYQKRSRTSTGNRHGYAIAYGGVEIIMDGQSSLEGVDESTFPRAVQD